MANSCGQSLFYGPAALQAYTNCRFADMEQFGPFTKQARFSIEREFAITSHVAHLLSSSRPITIIRRIAFRILFPFKCQSFRWLSHVSGKVLERIPALATVDSTLSIILALFKLRIPHSRQHIAPYSIKTAVCFSVCSKQSLASLSRVASTAFRSAPFQVSLINDCRATASALAVPIPTVLFAISKAADRQIAKY